MAKSVVKRVGVKMDSFLNKSYWNYLERLGPKLKKPPSFVEYSNELAEMLQANRNDLSFIFSVKFNDSNRKPSSRINL